MNGITTYKSKNKVYEIPEDKRDSFLKSFPDAIEVKSFTVGKDTFDIPIDKVGSFQSSMPEAKPVKKKDSSLIGEDSKDGAEKPTPQGFRTITEFPKVEQVPVPDFKMSTDKEIIEFQEKGRKKREEQKQQYSEVVNKTLEPLEKRKLELNTQLEPNLDEINSLMRNLRRTPEEDERLEALNIKTQPMVDDLTAIEAAIDLTKKSKKYIETSDKGVLESMFKSPLAKDFFTLGSMEVFRGFDMLKIAKKYQGDPNSLSEDEQTALFAYGLNQEIESNVEKGLESMVGSGIAETIPFMIQFALSGPTSSTAKEGTKIGVKKALKKITSDKLANITAKAIGTLTGAAVRTPMLSDMYKGVAERQIGVVVPEIKDGKLSGRPIEETQESPLEAVKKSFASTYVTSLTEEFGRFGDKIFKVTGKKLPSTPMVNKIGNQTINNIKSATGFQSWGSEFMEEILEAYGQAAVTGDRKLSEVWDNKEMLAVFLTTGAISGSFSAANMALKGNNIERSEVVTSLRESEEELKPQTQVDIDNILKGDDVDKNAEQLDTYIKKKQADGADATDIENIVGYAVNKSRVEGMNVAEGAIHEEVITPKEEAIESEISEETTPVEEKPTKEVKVAEKPSKVEPKKEKDGVQEKLQEKAEVREDVGKEIAEEKKRVGEEEVLEKPKTIKEAESNIKMLETEKASLQESLKDVPKDQKSKLNQEIQGIDNQIQTQQDYATEIESRPLRQETKEEKRKGVSDKDMPEIDRPVVQDRPKVEKAVAPKIDRKAVESRAKESVKKIGDVTKKPPVKLAQEAQSFEELDYLYEIYPKEISFKEYGKIKNKLRDKGLFDDTGNRIESIRDQVIENQAQKLDNKLKNELGDEKYSELKAKRSEEVDKISDSFAKLAGVKFAVGDGKKVDIGKEMVTIAKGLIEIGVIDIRLGTKAAMDKLKSFFDISAPEKSHLVNEYKNLVAKELGTREFDKKIKEADVEAIDKRTKERLVKREQAEKRVNESRKKKAKSTFQRLFVDKSEPFKVAILKEGTELSRRAVDYFNLQAGVSGRNMSEFESARKKVLGKFNDILDKDRQRALEEYITLKRVIELDTLYDKRGANRLDHESGLDKEEAEIVLAALESNDKTTLESHGIDSPVDWDIIKERAQAYWDTMQDKLKDLRDNGLITEDVYSKLSEEQPHYTPRRYLEHFIGNVDKGGSISGIDALSGGSMGSTLADVQTLLGDVIARTNRSIARNKTLTTLHDVAVQNPNDVIKPAVYKKTKTEEGKTEIGYTDKIEKEEERLNKLRERLEREKRSEKEIEEYIEAERKYIEPEFENAPSGYTTYKFKKNGVTDAIYLNNEYIEDFEQAPDSETIRMIKNGLSWVSGNKILKAFATGYNPEFAIKNLPLDMLHILTTTEAYSPVYPVATAQLAKDLAVVAGDAFSKKGRYKDFVEEGGSMEFLSTQGSLAPRKFKAYNKLSIGARALADGAAYLGNTSEILTRLALRERMIKNYTSDFKKKNDRDPNTAEKKEIQERATAYSRNYLDFSQGGAAIKFLNSVIPYLNAGFQVTRGSLRAAQRNPKVFWFKMGQLAATATAITAYNLGLTGEDEEKAKERKEYYLNDISDRRKTDSFILMTNIDYKDSKGVKHYVYFAFPKDNIQKIVTGWAESALAASIGVPEQGLNERRWMEVQSLTQNLTDIGNLPPVHSALLGSSLNKDLYYRTDLWGGRDLGKYKSQEYSPGLTPQRYIKAGEWSDKVAESLGFEGSLSPVRMQYFMSQFTTKSNVIGTAIGEALDMTMVGVDLETQELINKTTGERLVTAPFSRRFFKKTSPYVKKSSAKEEQAKLNAVKQKNDNILNPLLKKKDYKAIIDHITKEIDPYEAQRMIDKLRKSTLLGDTDYRILELTFVSPKARARAWYNMYSEADGKGKKYLIKESARIGGVFTSGEFMNELGQIMLSDKNLEKDMKTLEKEKR